MKPTLVQPKLIALFTCFALVLFCTAPSLLAQEQAPPPAQAPAQAQTDINAAAAPPATATDENITNDESHNPPSRVARISLIDGSVSIQPGGTGDWGTVQRNRPVTIGDKIWVDKESRAELQAGSIAIHLGDMTALSFLNLDANITQIRLPEGKINFRVREIRQGETYEVDTPNLSFTVKEAGAFRIDVNENGDFTSVTAIRGSGEVASAGQTYTVKAGERLDAAGTEGNVKVSTGPAAQRDALDQWAQERDLREERSVSGQHVNRDTVGYSDLDDYGTWKHEDTYGDVWVPNDVGPDWAPYSDGSWAYVAPWGWTWVGYEPWGFAPYHYGRWHWFGGYWGWSPGPIWAAPFYGPAYVGWLGGFGFGFGIGFGWGWGGGFGWFPLGWGEPFHPWYPCGWGYWRGINVHNTYFHNFNAASYRNFSNYAYAHNVHAVTTASHNSFVNGEHINRAAQHVTEASLRNAQVTNGIHAAPTRTSSLGASNMLGHVAKPSASTQNRGVMARTAPSAAAAHSPARTISSSGGGRASNSTAAHSVSPNKTGTRSWSAQGNATDSGRAPQGFGNNASHPNNTTSTARTYSPNRPPWAGSGRSGTGGSSSTSRNSVNRPPSSYNSGRSYNPPSYGNRGYSTPRSYGAPRGYSAPRSAPRSYSAPRSSGDGSHSGSSGGSHSGGSSHSSSGHVGGGGGHHK